MKLREVLDSHGIDVLSLKQRFDFGKSIWTLETSGEKAVDLWLQLRALVNESGYWPVLLGHDEEMPYHEEQLEDMRDEGLTVELVLEKLGQLTQKSGSKIG